MKPLAVAWLMTLSFAGDVAGSTTVYELTLADGGVLTMIK